MPAISWPDVPARLARLAPHQPPYAWADLETPLTPAELADLQRQLGVDLPPDYQQFLLYAGRGGPGPGFGILPVRSADGRWKWHGDGREHDPVRVAEPFPLRTSDWRPEEDLEADYPTGSHSRAGATTRTRCRPGSTGTRPPCSTRAAPTARFRSARRAAPCGNGSS